jgi:hypothetical protein
MCEGQIEDVIQTWIKYYKNVLSKNEENFLTRSLKQNKDPFGALYLLMKVHKTPLYSPVIISKSVSLLHSLGIWVNSHLQQFAKLRPAYAGRSSRTTKRLPFHI